MGIRKTIRNCGNLNRSHRAIKKEIETLVREEEKLGLRISQRLWEKLKIKDSGLSIKKIFEEVSVVDVSRKDAELLKPENIEKRETCKFSEIHENWFHSSNL